MTSTACCTQAWTGLGLDSSAISKSVTIILSFIDLYKLIDPWTNVNPTAKKKRLLLSGSPLVFTSPMTDPEAQTSFEATITCHEITQAISYLKR